MQDESAYRIGDRILFGAAYYPEYQPVERMAEDFRLMREAGFNLIRVGESVWSSWEPRDGEFELDWLRPVLDGAHAHGISVVLGTPTYAVPPWLMLKHPEIAAESKTGVRVPWGARQETDTSHPVFLAHAERIIRKVIARYADHPAIVGYQVDNEPGQQVPHNAHVFTRFKQWLVAKYNGVEAINAAWNLTHWAHRLNHIDELWLPDGNHVPQYDLDWRRFHAQQTTEYIAWQVKIVREYASTDQFITTCIDPMRPAVDDRGIGAACDVIASNQYIATQEQLGPETDGDYAFPPSGSWAPFYISDRTWAIGQRRFMVTETNATSVGFPWFNYPMYDGQWRQVSWAMIARGARAVEYWHWHTMHGSWETFWGGVLPHSFSPGRVYGQLAELGNEIVRAGAAVEGIVPDANVGLLFSMPNRWAFEYHPPMQDPGATPEKQGPADRAAYERIVYRFYGGLDRAGHQVRVMHAADFELADAGQLARDLPTLVVPALYLASDALVANLLCYAQAGGHLVIGIRTGYADEIGRPKLDRQPAGLVDAAGVWYDEFSNLVSPLKVSGQLSGTALSLVEGLIAAGAEVVASYQHPHFGRWPAVTSRAHGAGRISYVGAFPGLDLAKSLGDWLKPDHPWQAQLVPGALTVHGATNRAGERLWFVHNFGWEPRTITPPMPVEDVLSAERVTELALRPWDVRILREVIA